MIFLRLLPVVLSLLLLAAHFYRGDLPAMSAVCLALPALLFLRQAWVPWLLQLVLVLGAAEWLRTLYALASMRIAFEQPWMRLAVILGAVALFTLLSGLVFRSRALQRRYRSTDEGRG